MNSPCAPLYHTTLVYVCVYVCTRGYHNKLPTLTTKWQLARYALGTRSGMSAVGSQIGALQRRVKRLEELQAAAVMASIPSEGGIYYSTTGN